MSDEADRSELEAFWEAVLSEDPPRIRQAWLDLTDEEASAVLEHLQRMTSEDGWADVQRQAAADALRVIRELED